jgi:hypothetical protein
MNGTVGATTPSTGVFTTLTATSNIYTSARYFAQRQSGSLSFAIGGYSDGSAGTVLTGAIGDIVAFGNVGGDGVIFANSNTERMRLTDNSLEIKNSGIKFLATQSASTNANTLDDYEEGTWTPVYEGLAGSIGSTAYSLQRGRYTKIGRQVVLTADIVLTNKGSWTSGVIINGLPFTNNGSLETCMGSVILGFVDFSAGQLYTNPRSTGGDNVRIYIDITVDNADREILSTTAVTNNSVFYLNMSYTTS